MSMEARCDIDDVPLAGGPCTSSFLSPSTIAHQRHQHQHQHLGQWNRMTPVRGATRRAPTTPGGCGPTAADGWAPGTSGLRTGLRTGLHAMP